MVMVLFSLFGVPEEHIAYNGRILSAALVILLLVIVLLSLPVLVANEKYTIYCDPLIVQY